MQLSGSAARQLGGKCINSSLAQWERGRGEGKKVAFTLAELLITLGIIGIVSAITIPTIVNKYKRTVFETQFKKAVSVVNQAVKLWKAEEEDDLWSVYYDDWDRKGTQLRQAYYKYLKGSLDTRKYALESELIPYYTSAKGSKQKAHYCPSTCCSHPIKNSFISFDGIMYNVCARDGQLNFAFDVNGYDKGPNKWGVDLFDFDYNQNNELYNNYGCGPGSCAVYFHNKNTNVNDGMGCTTCAMKDKNYFKKIDL